MDYSILAPLGAAVIRSTAGWWEHNLKDGFQPHDLKKLGETLLVYVPATLGLIFGFNVDPLQASGFVLVGDIGKSWVKDVMTQIFAGMKKK